MTEGVSKIINGTIIEVISEVEMPDNILSLVVQKDELKYKVKINLSIDDNKVKALMAVEFENWQEE